MIAAGTVCLIVWTNNHPELLGYECTVIGHETLWCGERNLVELRDKSTAVGPDRCFLPLRPPGSNERGEWAMIGKPIQEHFDGR